MNTTLAHTTPSPANVVPFQPGPPPDLDANALLSKAVEAKLPVESMERLLAMREQLRAEQAAGQFANALAGFQFELPPIPKNQVARIQSQRGSFQYRYADLADIQRAIAAPLHEHGLAVTFDTEERGETLDVICSVHHVAGHSQSVRFPVPVDRSARMNSAQAVGAALTYGRRYALTAALGIVTADEDTDAQGAPERTESHLGAQRPSRTAPHTNAVPSGASQPARQSEASIQPPPPAQQARISTDQHRRMEARIKELGLDRERVKRWCASRWSVGHFPDLSPAQYQELDQRLEGFARQSQQEASRSSPPASAQEQAEAERDAQALERAKGFGWRNDIGALPQTIAKIRASSARYQESAQYADDRRAHREDLDTAAQLRALADRLEAWMERTARQQEAA